MSQSRTISDVLYIYYSNIIYLQTDAASAEPTNRLLIRTRLFVVVAIVAIIKFDISMDRIRYFITAVAVRLQHVYKSKLLQRLKIYLCKSFINLNQWMHKAYLPSFGIPRLNHYRIRYICTMLSYSLLQLTNQTVGSLGLVRQVCLVVFLIVFFIGQTLILFLIHNKSKIWFKTFI